MLSNILQLGDGQVHNTELLLSHVEISPSQIDSNDPNKDLLHSLHKKLYGQSADQIPSKKESAAALELITSLLRSPMGNNEESHEKSTKERRQLRDKYEDFCFGHRDTAFKKSEDLTSTTGDLLKHSKSDDFQTIMSKNNMELAEHDPQKVVSVVFRQIDKIIRLMNTAINRETLRRFEDSNAPGEKMSIVSKKENNDNFEIELERKEETTKLNFYFLNKNGQRQNSQADFSNEWRYGFLINGFIKMHKPESRDPIIKYNDITAVIDQETGTLDKVWIMDESKSQNNDQKKD